MKEHLIRDLNYFMGLLIGAWVDAWTPILLVILWISVYRFWQWRKYEPEAETKETADA